MIKTILIIFWIVDIVYVISVLRQHKRENDEYIIKKLKEYEQMIKR